MLPQELLRRLELKELLNIIDVRHGFEFRNGHIPGALHAPFLKILFQVARLPTDKNTELIITCELGPRAQMAKTLLGMLGYQNTTLLEGHMASWRKAGYPQVKRMKK